MPKLRDPVEEINKDREASEIEAGVQSVEIDGAIDTKKTRGRPKAERTDAVSDEGEFGDGAASVSLDGMGINDLKSIPRQNAIAAHPFEGYPMEDIVIGTMFDKKLKRDIPVKTKKTYLVFMSPTKQVPQDRSGKNVSVFDSETKRERRVNLATYHSRFIRNFEEGDESNTDVVFDRKVTLGDGSELFMAVVPQHTVRAQLFFEKEPKSGKTVVNQDYMLADMKQVSRLRRIFDWIYSNKIASGERAAQDFDQTPESTAGDLQQ